MKRSDLAMIILIAAVSVGIAYFVANSLLGGMTEQGVKVKTVDPITSTVEEPDKAIFNDESINPSVEVNINQTEEAAAETDAEAKPATQTTPTTPTTPSTQNGSTR